MFYITPKSQEKWIPIYQEKYQKTLFQNFNFLNIHSIMRISEITKTRNKRLSKTPEKYGKLQSLYKSFPGSGTHWRFRFDKNKAKSNLWEHTDSQKTEPFFERPHFFHTWETSVHRFADVWEYLFRSIGNKLKVQYVCLFYWIGRK